MGEQLSPLLSGFYLPVHHFTSVTDNEEDRVVVIYLGINKGRARLWGKRILGSEFTQTPKGKMWVWALEKQLNNKIPDCNLVMIETNWVTELILARYKGFKMPMWIQLCLDVSRPLRELKKSSTKLREQIPRLIRKYSLELEISSDEKDLDEFIDTMHIPYISGRHKDTAFISSRAEIKKMFDNSDLFFVRKDGKRISGTLVEYSDDMASLHYIGLKDNNPEYLRVGGIASLYYFAILHAMDKGISVFNMGGTSPFLSDGVAFFKLTLKPYVMRTSYLGDYFIKLILRKPSPYLSEFLINNPFLNLHDRNHFEKIIFIDNSQSGYKRKLNELLKKTYCERVERTVYAVNNHSPDSKLFIESIIPEGEKVEIVSWDSMFNIREAS